MTRRLVIGLLGVAVGFGVVTLLALEGREVVVLETVDPAGAIHRTRTWIADDAGSAWVEAANPERPFVADLRTRPALVVERGGVRQTCTAEILPSPSGHERIRGLLQSRYGWADCWIAMLADTSGSLGIRLTCA